MAEVQTSTRAGETTARFIEFVMMQAQNASLFLGLIPNPGSGKTEVNLDLARMFIDQLVMIQEKTRGNLSTEETNVLRNALTNLQMAFFEVSQPGSTQSAQEPALASAEEHPIDAASPPAAESAPISAEGASESKKRFSKSYGS